MRYVDRATMDPPISLQSEAVQLEVEQMIAYFSQKGKQKQQRRYSFNREILQSGDIRFAVSTLFNGKCAYCETILYGDNYDVDHFRPMHGAMNLDGKVHEEHYWWLSYVWENLYPCCKTCNRYKRTRFPVSGRRLKPGEAIENEKYLLLDPCNYNDFLEPQFKMDDEGFYKGQTRKGEITIDILNLNRESLVLGRKKVKEEVEHLVKEAKKLTSQGERYRFLQQSLMDKINLNAPFFTIALYYVNINSTDNKGIKSKEIFNQFIQEISQGTPNYISEIAISPEVQNKISQKESIDLTYSLELNSKVDKEAYFASAKSIQKVEIKNFKIIKNLEIDFPKSDGLSESWLVLLGENGTGKSSVLQAIALALGGAERANALGLNASKFVNRNVRASSGYVKVHFEGIDEPVELRFEKDNLYFSSNYNDSKVILLAFGSTRLMSPLSNVFANENLKNLHNLFNPFATLPNIEDWISDPNEVNASQFNQIAIELKRLLNLSEDKLIYRRKTGENNYELFIKARKEVHGHKLSELSAGYQAIIILTLNIIRELLHTWNSIEIAEGIVLIDEIGVHLHPRWKMNIVSVLREIFPAMTFIITTHEPLCLRGVKKGEVALMTMDEKANVIAINEELPSPSSLTVEQLITSKFFGLLSTYDPEVEPMLNQYNLLTSKQSLTANEKKELTALKDELVALRLIDKEGTQHSQANTLDAGWVANPQKQEEVKKQISKLFKFPKS